MDFSTEQLRAMLEATPDPTLIADSSGAILWANARVAPLLGYSPDELTGKSIALLLARHQDSGSIRKALLEPAASAAPLEATKIYTLLQRNDGSEFPAQVILSPVETEQGLCLFGTVRDDGENAATREQLRASLEALETEKAFSENLISTLQAIVLLLDDQGRVKLCNPYFETLTGFEQQDLIGRDWFDVAIPERIQAELRAYFPTVLSQGIDQGHVNPIKTKDGRELTIEWHSKVLTDAGGKAIGLLSTGHDVTAATANAEELAKAKRVAEEATHAKSRFLAAASHDLRQPLQATGIYLSVLEKQLENDFARDICKKLFRSHKSMTELLNALLDISRLDAGSIEPSIEEFMLTDIIRRIQADNAPHAEAKGLSLETSGPDICVRSDPALLERIIENFVSNAIRYTEQGRITIKWARRGPSAEISVTDTGVGIPEDALDTIFEAYYQLDNPSRDRKAGLGLGLSIVRYLADLLGHTLSVSSTPNAGSTFAIQVPLAAADQPSDLTQPSVEPVVDDQRTVLIIDDDEVVVDSTSLLLESANLIPHTARDGEEALAVVRSGLRPDLVISDYRLPRCTGVEVLRQLRTEVQGELPAILMTGDTSGVEIEASELGDCRVVHKPIDPSTLLALVREDSSPRRESQD